MHYPAELPSFTDATNKRFPCLDAGCARTFTRSDLRNKHVRSIHPHLEVPEGGGPALAPASVEITGFQSSSASPTIKRPRLEANHLENSFLGGPASVTGTLPASLQSENGRGDLSGIDNLLQFGGHNNALATMTANAQQYSLDETVNPVHTMLPTILGEMESNLANSPSQNPYTFDFDHDLLIWNALGIDANGPQDVLSGGNDIPWVVDYNWLNQDMSVSQNPAASTSTTSARAAPAVLSTNNGRLNGPDFNLFSQEPSRNGERLDSFLLSSMLQDVQSRGEVDLETWRNRFTTGPGQTPIYQYARSRAVSPAAEAAAAAGYTGATAGGTNTQDDDRWPMNWQPAAQVDALAGNTNAIIKLHFESVDPSLHTWQKFWIDQNTYEKVKQCFLLARAMPGPDVNKLRLPESLAVVNTFISLYFENFYPQFPILHLPTLQPSKTPPLLIAGLICIGACYSELPGARELAIDLIEAIRKTLNALFEHDARNLRMASFIHVYLLMVIAGLFIGNKRIYELAETSRGTLINLCRRAELLDTLQASRTVSDTVDTEVRWQQWVSLESKKRLGVAICLLDTVFPAMLDIPAYHSHRDMFNLSMPCEEQFWKAPSAIAWSRVLGLASAPPSPFFVNCIVPMLLPSFSPSRSQEEFLPLPHLNSFSTLLLCSSLHHHIYEFRTHLSFYLAGGLEVPLLTQTNYDKKLGSGFEGRREWLREALESWKLYYSNGTSGVHTQTGRLLNHLGHVSLYVYIGGLYDAVGKRGPAAVERARAELQGWAASAGSRHAVWHALAIVELLREDGMDKSIYYPLSGFVATLTVWAYLKHHPATDHCEPVSPEADATSTLAILSDPRLSTFLRLNAGAGEGIQRPSVTAAAVLGRGAELLARGKAWRIGAALALVLAKKMEEETEFTPC